MIVKPDKFYVFVVNRSTIQKKLNTIDKNSMKTA